MRVLVTGANGYIGTGIVMKLIENDINVVATDIKNECNIKCNYISANIFDVENPFGFFGKPDILLHLAWRDGFKHSADSHIEDLGKHYHFIKKMCESGLKKVCVMGSVHEVGFYEGSVNESTPTNPQSNYGVAKNALRNLVELIARDNNVLFQWIRGYYIVGNTHLGCSIFSKITEAEERGDKTFPFTNGKNQFDFIDYSLFCEQVVSVILQDEVLGIINCCSGYPQSIGERVEKFISDNQYQIKLQYGAFPNRPYDSKAVWGDDKKITRILEKRKNEC